jgi:dimethylaniline monooxygenase (N-oxide forming)
VEHLSQGVQSLTVVGRGYENFWVQWSHGLSEFSAFSMNRPAEADGHYDFYCVKYTTEYLDEYCTRKDARGRMLRNRMIFSANIQVLKNMSGVWHVSGQVETFIALKVTVASSLYSMPNMPTLPRKETFGGPIVHTEKSGDSRIMNTPDIKKLVALGTEKVCVGCCV